MSIPAEILEEGGPALARNILPHVLLGMTGAGVENQTILPDASRGVKTINLALGGITGAMGGRYGWLSKPALGALTAKQLGLLATNEADKFIRIQQPIADTNLETARIQRDMAEQAAEKAKHFTAGEVGQLGLAGAGLAGAGGLAYYLYKTLGAGKKRPSPKVTIDLPAVKGQRGDVKIEGTEDTLDLSKQLYTRLRRDQRRALLSETRLATQHKQPGELGHADKRACLGISADEPTTEQRLLNIARLLA